MPIDSSHIQNTIASQEAYFDAQNARRHNQAKEGSLQGPGGGQGYNYQQYTPPTPPAAPYLPPAMFQTALQAPPNILQGMMSHPAFGPMPDYRTTGTYYGRKAGSYVPGMIGFGQGALSTMADFGAMSALVTAGVGGGSGLLGSLGMATLGGAAATLAVPAAIGAAVGFGGDLMFRNQIKDYQYANKLREEFETNPTLRAVGAPSMTNLTGFMSRSRKGVLGARVGGNDVTMEDFFNVMSTGTATGQFDYVRGMEEFEKKTKELFSASLKVSKILKTTMEEGAKTLGALKQMGFLDISSQVQQVNMMTGAASMANVSVGRMLEMSQIGRDITGRAAGAGMASTQMAWMGRARGSAAENIEIGGGAEMMTQRIVSEMMRTMRSGMGTAILGSAMTGRNVMNGNAIANAGAIGADLQRDPAALAKLLSEGGRTELINKLGSNAPLIGFQQNKKALEGALGRKVDPYTYQLMYGGDITDIKNLQWQSDHQGELAGQQLRANIGAGLTRVTQSGLAPGEQNNIVRGSGLIGSAIWGLRTAGTVLSKDTPRALGTSYDLAGDWAKKHGLDVGEWAASLENWVGEKTGAAYTPAAGGIIGGTAKAGVTGRVIEENARALAMKAQSPQDYADLVKQAKEKETAIFGDNDRFMQVWDSPGEEGQKLRNTMMQYLNDPNSVNATKVRGLLLTKGQMTTEQADEVMKKMSDPRQRSQMQEALTNRAAFEVGQGEGYRAEDAQSLGSMKFDKKTVQQWVKGGSRESFAALMNQAKKFSSKDMERLQKSGFVGGVISTAISKNMSVDQAFKSVQDLGPGTGYSGQAGTAGLEYDSKNINIDGPKQVLINVMGNDIKYKNASATSGETVNSILGGI